MHEASIRWLSVRNFKLTEPEQGGNKPRENATWYNTKKKAKYGYPSCSIMFPEDFVYYPGSTIEHLRLRKNAKALLQKLQSHNLIDGSNERVQGASISDACEAGD